MSCTFLYNRIDELEEQVVELEKLLIEAHFTDLLEQCYDWSFGKINFAQQRRGDNH